MNTFRVMGYVGIASVALAISANTPTLAETQPDRGAVVEKSNNLVHRVSHTLAAAEQYTGSAPSGYKWGQKARKNQSKENWSGSKESPSGYKWGKSSAAVVGVDRPDSSSYAEQTRNPWGRRDYSEQARNPWGRRDYSEQARNPWGRRDYSEQARNPWGRR
jgi:hypothetical protein